MERPRVTRTPDRGDLAGPVAVRIQPHPGGPRDPAGAGQAEVGEGVDHQLLDAVDVTGYGGMAHGHRDDRVAGQLARPVVGDVAAPVGLDHSAPNSDGPTSTWRSWARSPMV